jgi:type II secretion system protein H
MIQLNFKNSINQTKQHLIPIKNPQQGFTLLEIMIVLVIIGIMASVVVLNVNSSNYSGFEADGLKIAATLEIIADESVYTNSVITCNVNPNGFICQGYKNGEWRDINLRNLISWSWPQSISIKSIYVNGRPIKDDEKIRFFPNGNISAMSFQISDGVHNAWVDGNINGEFEVNN